MRSQQHLEYARNGATDVKLVVILPVFFVVVLGVIDIGHASMVRNVIETSVIGSAWSGFAVTGQSVQCRE